MKETRKKELMNQIIIPVMEEKDFVLTENRNGTWIWKKEVEGVMEAVSILDFDGRMDLHIGVSRGGVNWVNSVNGESLLYTLESPRTTADQCNYRLHEKTQKDLYENLLLDFRDILLKNCDTVLVENARKLKQIIPNKKHYEYMCNNREQLVKEYSQRLGIDGTQNILEVYDKIIEQVRELMGKPLAVVENDLVGYAALLEEEILRQYGGVRKENDELGTVIITQVGFKEPKRTFNTMTDMFWMWKYDGANFQADKENIEMLYDENQR